MSAVEAAPTIASLLRESELPRHEARILLRAVLGCEHAHLVAHAEDGVEPSSARTAKAWFARRRAGEPVTYITGTREFYGLSMRVTADVLIPRPETEQLVDIALERLAATPSARVLELGTGSGAIAVALAAQRPQLEITATDISEPALAIARRNAAAHAAAIDFVKSDWFESLGDRRFDLILSNPPYVSEGDRHLEEGDLPFEPRVALVAGEGGFSCVRTIADEARRRLLPGGSLLLEHGHEQGERCVAMLRALGYEDVRDFRDLAGLSRVCAGIWRG